MTTASWHPAALHDLEHSNMTISEVAEKYQRSKITIQKLLQRSAIVRKNPPKRRGPRRRDNSLPISRVHHVIGIRLNMNRGSRGTTEYADQLGISPHLLVKMEVGQHDFKLSQIQAIADKLNLPISELMKGFESNLYQQNDRRPDVRNV